MLRGVALLLSKGIMLGKVLRRKIRGQKSQEGQKGKSLKNNLTICLKVGVNLEEDGES